MYAAKAECYDDWGPEECFSLVYPVSYTLPDGSVMDVASDDTKKDRRSEILVWR